MSFHLSFAPVVGALEPAQFEALFVGRPHYDVADGQAAYQNADTGVYFLFDHEEGELRFSINTRRSEIFAEEAAEELAAILAGADMPFSAEAFLADWRAVNREAIAAMLAEGRAPLTLPLRTNREVWRWNRDLARHQAEIEGEAFAPPLIFLPGPDGAPRATYVWLVTRATAKPPAAEAVLLADDPAPKLRDKLLGGTPQPQTIGAIQIRWLRDLGFPVWRSSREMLVFHVPPGKREPNILASMASAHAYAKPAGAPIAVGEILDRETVDAVRAELAG
jgi:hypothetical protein